MKKKVVGKAGEVGNGSENEERVGVPLSVSHSTRSHFFPSMSFIFVIFCPGFHPFVSCFVCPTVVLLFLSP